jgi:hypothetical protein
LAKLGDSRFGVKWFHSTNLNIMELGISGHFYSISRLFYPLAYSIKNVLLAAPRTRQTEWFMALDYHFFLFEVSFVNADLIWDSLVMRQDANDHFIDQIIHTVKMIYSNDLL